MNRLIVIFVVANWGMIELEIIVILQVSTVEQHITNVILCVKKPRILPVIFHNLQGYDAHLFIKQLSKIDGKLDCIPSTEEKYLSFSKVIKVGEFKHISGDVLPINFEIKFL